MKTLSENERRRVIQAMGETQHSLTRAMRYSPEFRDHNLIAFYHRHIQKLTDLLEGRRELPPDPFAKQEGEAI